MKQISKFQAADGAEFDDEAKCIAYEQLCVRVERIMARLPKVDIHGEDFVQHDGPTVLGVQRDLVLLYEGAHPGMVDRHTERARNADRPLGMSMIGRYIDDSAERPIRAAWWRIQRMDANFREYEQPYFAIQANRRASERRNEQA